MTVRVGINGFGRIGRVVMSAALARKDIEIVHIKDLSSPATSAIAAPRRSRHTARRSRGLTG